MSSSPVGTICVAVTLTDDMRDLINLVKDKCKEGSYELSDASMKNLAGDCASNSVSYKSLSILSRYLKSVDSGVSLHSYMKSTKLMFPACFKIKTKKPSIEMIRRKEYLQIKAEERAYNQMMHGTYM